MRYLLSKSYYFLQIIFLSGLFFFSLNFDNISGSLLVILIVIAQNILFSLLKLRERILFFVFQITFIVFYLGRIITQFYFGTSIFKYFDIDFNDNLAIRHVLITIFLGIVFFSLGYRMFYTETKKKIENKYFTPYLLSLRKIVLILFYISFIAQILVLAERISVSQLLGYTGFYRDYVSSLPILVRRFASLFEFSALLYFATLPSKKELRLPIILFFILGIGSLGYGQRNGFILTTMFILVYFAVRDIYVSNNEVWLKRKYFLWIFAVIPVLLFFLAWFSYFRSGIVSNIDFLEGINLFFYSQGNSASILEYTKIYEDLLPNGKFYSFGPAITFFKDSLVFDVFNIFPSYARYSKSMAIEGHSFSMTISYFRLGGAYLNGAGLGSSYLAELYVDFGYIGVSLGSFIYGFFVAKFIPMVKKNVWWAFFAFNIAINVIYAPRAEFLGFAIPFLSVFNWMVIIILHYIAKNMSSKYYVKRVY